MEDNFKKAKMFNRKASRKKSKSDLVIKTLSLKKGDKIADIGSGGGFFVKKFAKQVKNEGQVYAIDTNTQFLKYIELEANQNNIKNISIIHSKDDNPNLPKEKLDYIFLRNVYHHLKNRIKYFQILGKGLKKNGEIIIIEHNGKGFLNFNKVFGHYIKPDFIKNEMNKAGYDIKKEYDFIKQQSFIIFTKKKLNE
jgi:ubiquinone/menaquinone biosynthesis C-methylase UbiE